MRTQLDERIPRGGAAIWRTVTKGGKRYTLQVYIRPGELERLVAHQIDEHGHDHHIECDSGPLSISLTRQS